MILKSASSNWNVKEKGYQSSSLSSWFEMRECGWRVCWQFYISWTCEIWKISAMKKRKRPKFLDEINWQISHLSFLSVSQTIYVRHLSGGVSRSNRITRIAEMCEKRMSLNSHRAITNHALSFLDHLWHSRRKAD